MKRMSNQHKSHVLKWKQSGLSMKQYCREHGISYWSFRDWKKMTESDTFQNSTGFVELPVVIKNQHKEYEPVEIILKNGLRIIVKENSATCRLKEIISILEGLS